MTPVDIDKLKELYERANEPEPTNLVTHDSVERPRASTNAMIWRDWHHRRDLAARELLDLTPALIAKAERVDALEVVLRPLVDRLTESEASFTKADELIGGPITDADGVFVTIGELRAARNALSPKESEK